MKRAILAMSVLCLGAATAIDVYQQYGVDRKEAEKSFVSWVVGSGSSSPGVPRSLRALAVGSRGQAMKELFAAARTYYGSEAFRARYAELTGVNIPSKPAPARSRAQIKAQQDAEMTKNITEMEKAIAQMPKAQQAEMRPTLDAMRKMMSQNAENLEASVESDHGRFQQEQQAYEEALAKAKAANPAQEAKEHLREALQRFLRETEGIDYAAGVVNQGGLRRFSNKAFEDKSDYWKKGFRAGREATEAARGFTRAWLAELG